MPFETDVYVAHLEYDVDVNFFKRYWLGNKLQLSSTLRLKFQLEWSFTSTPAYFFMTRR
jgi:hypothetical protein